MPASSLAFAPGDVFQTEPQPGFWGCAVVLTANPKTSQFYPQFHVGITPIVFRHAYSLLELDLSKLSVLRFTRDARISPDTWATRAEEVCIGIYTARSRGDLNVIASVDPVGLHPAPLTLGVGDGTSGKYPLCGPLRKNIGSEAVVAWRSVHDAEAFAREVVAARHDFEAFEAKRLTKQRESKRKRRRDA